MCSAHQATLLVLGFTLRLWLITHQQGHKCARYAIRVELWFTVPPTSSAFITGRLKDTIGTNVASGVAVRLVAVTWPTLFCSHGSVRLVSIKSLNI